MRPTTYDQVARSCTAQGLGILGAFHPNVSDAVPGGTGTLILLGPDGPDFWRAFKASPEFAERGRDPLDRWSRRVVGALATQFNGTAHFPFGGPPYLPFIAWARRSGRVWPSPVGLLVHEKAGLFVSYRGALALPQRLDLPPSGARPCDTCPKPCLSACPVGALGEEGYDVPACRDYLATEPGTDCLDRGCAVRRACPVGRDARPDAQSAFHMAAFHGTRRE